MAEVPETVSYELLQDLLRAERRSNKLMPVATRFWILTREFLDVIMEEFRREQAKDPFSRKVMLLTDQVKNARHAAESLWTVRERKIAMLALAATRDRKRPDVLTPEEAALYEQLVRDLDQSRAQAFEGVALAGPEATTAAASSPAAPTGARATSSSTARPPAPPRAPETAPSASTVTAGTPPAGPSTAPAASQAAPAPSPGVARPGPAPGTPARIQPDARSAGSELVTIRALGDIPPFVGPDMQTYLLKSGDIATVPPSIAQLLVRRNKAEILEDA